MNFYEWVNRGDIQYIKVRNNKEIITTLLIQFHPITSYQINSCPWL